PRAARARAREERRVSPAPRRHRPGRARPGDSRADDRRARGPHRQLRRGRLRRPGRPDANAPARPGDRRRRGAYGRRARMKSTSDPAIGVIGLYELEGLTDVKWQKVRTPFGDPSDAYCVGRFAGRRVVFLPRHGRGHRITPSELNFRANIWGLRFLGAQWVLSVSAVGSMKEEIRPLDLVIPDQFYDATRRRVSSFFGDGIVAHVGMADPVCPDLATALEKAASQTGATVHRGGTYICIEGPQFST